MIIRLATMADVPAIHALLCELAAFEGGTVRASLADLARDGFGERPLFEVLLAEMAGADRGGAAVGLLVFIPTYSSWQARPGVKIHDLFVRETARGQGFGQALVRHLAGLAAARGAVRMDVDVLDWNEGARRFYEGLGLSHRQGWLGYRVEGEGLTRL